MSWRRLWRDVGLLLSAGGLAVGRGDARAAEGDASPAHPRAMRRRGCASIVRPRRICWGRDGRAGGSAGLAGEQPTTNTTSPDSAQRATLPPSHCAIINPRRRARAPHTQTATAVCTESASRPAPRSLRPPRRPPRHRRLRRPCASRCPPRPRAPPSRREETTRHASPQSARGWPLAASTTPRPPSCAPRCVTRPSTVPRPAMNRPAPRVRRLATTTRAFDAPRLVTRATVPVLARTPEKLSIQFYPGRSLTAPSPAFRRASTGSRDDRRGRYRGYPQDRAPQARPLRRPAHGLHPPR